MKYALFLRNGLAVIVLVIFALSACKKRTQEVEPAKSVAEVVAETPDLAILTAALRKTGLYDTLNLRTRYLTFFAPNDSAFQALPAPLNSVAGIEGLAATDAAVATLKSTLKFHLLYGQVSTFSIQTGLGTNRVRTARGGADSLFFSKSVSRVVTLNGARITRGNVAADANGLVHVINAVLLPPAGDLVQTVAATADLKLVSAALAKTNLAATLQMPGPYTLFAPTDSAFAAALRTLNGTLTDEAAALNFINNTLSGGSTPSTTTVANVLRYHLAAGRYYSRAVAADSLRLLPTLAGRTVALSVSARDNLALTGGGNGGMPAQLRTANTAATNGVLHTVSRTLLPAP